jgi:hypothetical protein
VLCVACEEAAILEPHLPEGARLKRLLGILINIESSAEALLLLHFYWRIRYRDENGRTINVSAER